MYRTLARLSETQVDLRIIPMLMFTATALIVLALGNVPVAIMLGCLAVIIIS